MKFSLRHRTASRRQQWFLSACSALALTASLASSVLAAPAALTDHAKAQMADVLKVKATFTAAEKKMDSRLVFASRMARGEDVGTVIPTIMHAGTTANRTVEIRTNGKVPKTLRKSVVSFGGSVQSFQKSAGHVHATVPTAALTALAADPSVVSIRCPSHMATSVGALTSQGYVVMGSRSVTRQMGVNGTGVTVGVLSDSASQARIDALKASGDLNAADSVLVPYDDGAGGDMATDEGAAMMEIVQDMAPGATVIFATAGPTAQNFAANIEALAAAGCTIIVDDVGYSGDGPFQDDVIARGVDAVTAEGVLYFASAGNSGNLLNDNSGTWEGDYVDSGDSLSVDLGTTGTVDTTKNYEIASIDGFDANELIYPGEPYIDMEWSDALGASANDYDLFAFDSMDNLIGASVTTQDGTQDPVEELDSISVFGPDGNYDGPNEGDLLVIASTTGYTATDTSTTPSTVTTTPVTTAARYLRMDTNGGLLGDGTDGATSGHSAAANTFTTGATFWNSDKRGVKVIRAQDAHPTEGFSSDGPRRIFYKPDGTAITPGNFLAATGGGQVLQKPDATAVDGVSAETPGFGPFFGTSAAAPHAAGVAALIKSYNPSLTNVQIRNLMTSTAIDADTAGVDVTSGYGLVDALTAVMAAPTP